MADDTALCFTSANELVDLILSKRLSPVELLDTILDRVQNIDPILHAFVTLDPEHYIPAYDNIVVERIRAAGAIILGKTNTPSFGHKDTCDNLVIT